MLTGDKGETAETIGVSCGLLDSEEQIIFNIDSAPIDQLVKNLQNIENAIRSKKG
jgi:magnesium-transporting ATPase (P-type)